MQICIQFSFIDHKNHQLTVCSHIHFQNVALYTYIPYKANYFHPDRLHSTQQRKGGGGHAFHCVIVLNSKAGQKDMNNVWRSF